MRLRTRAAMVSIAFRRSVRSRPGGADWQRKGCQIRLHCLSAFSAFPTPDFGRDLCKDSGRLHCLSAFSAFPTPLWTSFVNRLTPSPLPFGVQCVPDPLGERGKRSSKPKSPLPFGVQCVPDVTEVVRNDNGTWTVSIAFRRSVRSRQNPNTLTVIYK